MPRGWPWLLISLLVIVLDLWSKTYLQHHLLYGVSYTLLPFLSLTLLYNHGAAFSFLNEASGWQQWFFSLIAIVVSAILIAWLLRLPAKRKWQALSAALIIGGAIGNLISRLSAGYVVDFIDFHVGSWHWPAFNIADTAICIGVFLLLIDAFVRR